MEDSKRNRIAFFLPNLKGGGAERIYVNLANQLAKSRPVDFVLVEADGVYLTQLSAQVRVHTLGCKNEYLSFWPLYRYIKQFHPGVMLSTLDLSSMIVILLRILTGIKVKIIISLVNTISLTERFPGWKKRLEKPLIHWLFPKADHLVALSTGVAQDYAAYGDIPLDRIHVIYNPVDMESIRLRRQQALDHRWFQSHDLPIILAAGRLTAQKNYALLLQAFYDLQKEVSSRLIILGEGEDRALLEEQVKKLGIQDRVDLPGFVENPYSYMAHADCFVLSSNYEGLACVLLEALACGCPVVSTNYQSGADEVLDGGLYGHLVPLNDSVALMGAMADVLMGNGRFAPAQWMDQFETSHVAEQYLKLINA